MSRPHRISRIAMALLWFVPGTMVLGSSCARDFRDDLVAAGTGFVADTAIDVLEALFPVADWVTAATQQTSA